MDWKNISLNSQFERDQNLIENKTFDIFLLEVECNIKNISKEEIQKHFKNTLQGVIDVATNVFNSNLDNILKDANKTRKIK